jgi:hypothetical protein
MQEISNHDGGPTIIAVVVVPMVPSKKQPNGANTTTRNARKECLSIPRSGAGRRGRRQQQQQQHRRSPSSTSSSTTHRRRGRSRAVSHPASRPTPHYSVSRARSTSTVTLRK